MAHRARRTGVALIVFSAAILCALTLFLMFWNLGANSISIASDEVIYVRVSQGVLHEGSFFPLMHGNVPTFEKPPLKLWLGALAPWILGESNFSFRALDGVLGALAVLGAVVLAWRISRSAPGALAVGFLVLAMPEWIIAQHGFRKVVLDGLLTVLILGAALAAWRVIDKREARRARYLFLVGVFSSLAVLTKSVAGFIPLACAVCSICAVAPRALVTRRALWLLLPFVVFVGYVLAVWQLGGVRGLRMFLGVEIVDRAFSGFKGHNTGSRWFYLWYIFIRGGAAPRVLAWVGVVGAVWAARRHAWARFILVWSMLPVVAYSLSASRAPWYVAPFFPFVCMVAVFGASAICDSVSDRKIIRILVTSMLLVATFVAAVSLSRSLSRNLLEVSTDTSRLPFDLLTERLRADYTKFGVLESAISARSNPRKGRFNVEGIYRETLKPDLVAVPDIRDLIPESQRVYFVKEESLGDLPVGWYEIGRVPAYKSRKWRVVAVVYP